MFETRVTWEKLKIELDLLATENPTSLLPLLLGLHSYLLHDESFNSIYRDLNYLNYEIRSQCEEMSEEERYAVLNDFFFVQKGFSTSSDRLLQQNDEELLMGSFLKFRSGHPLLVSMVYSHFAAQLDLPIYLSSIEFPHVLRWVRGSDTSVFVNIINEGQVLSDKQVVEMMNESSEAEECTSAFEILPAKTILSTYLKTILLASTHNSNKERELDTLNILIGLHPNNTLYLSQRSKVYRQLGNYQDALADLKRYFSFVDKSSASPDLKMALYELQALCSGHSKPKTLH